MAFFVEDLVPELPEEDGMSLTMTPAAGQVGQLFLRLRLLHPAVVQLLAALAVGIRDSALGLGCFPAS